MSQDYIACMMMQNCFLEEKLGAVKLHTLAAFNEIIESHEAGKNAANVVKGKGKPRQQFNQISHDGKKLRKKILGKCQDVTIDYEPRWAFRHLLTNGVNTQIVLLKDSLGLRKSWTIF